MSKRKLKVPERVIELGDGSMWRFRVDHGALYELEQHTGVPFMEFLGRLSPGQGEHGEVPPVPMSVMYDLAWALSVSYREDQEMALTFRQFLRLLPPLADMGSFLNPLMELMGEAFKTEEGGRGNAGSSPA